MSFKRVVLLGLAVYIFGAGSLTLHAEDRSINGLIGNVGIAAITNEEMDESVYIELQNSGANTYWGYKELGIVNLEEGNLNVREKASKASAVVGKMYNQAACEILGEEDGWYHITSGEVEGYVSKDYIISGIEAKLLGMELAYTKAVVQVNNLNVREGAGEEYAVVTQVAKGHELEVMESMDGWVKCVLNTDEVYVKEEYVEIKEGLNTAITISQYKYGMDVSDVRVDLCEYALQFVGNPYVWGGTSLTKGADCSGFVLSVYKNYGFKLPHYSRSQSNCGTEISYKDALPGDLLFYGNSKSTISHVAIYIGDGKIVHANDEKTGIIVSNAYYRTPVKACRLLEE